MQQHHLEPYCIFIIVKTNKNRRLKLSYVKHMFIHFWTSSVNICIKVYGFRSFLWKLIFLQVSNTMSFFFLRWRAYITFLYYLVVPCVQILSIAELITSLHVGSSHWHFVRWESVPGGVYNVTFQVTHQMYLAPSMLWCGQSIL